MHKVLLLRVITLTVLIQCQNLITHARNQPINEWAVHVQGGVSAAKAVARRLGFIYVEKLDALDNIYVMTRPEIIHHHHHHHTKRLKRQTEVIWAEQQIARNRARRGVVKPLIFNDPEFVNQWYLNRGSGGSNADMNIQEAWSLGYTGKGTVTSILDDGIDYTHHDLKDNYDKQASYDLNDKDDDPMPNKLQPQFNKHGTRCAGVVAARSNNSNCIVGVAYGGNIGGVRMLDGDVTDRVEASALGLRQQHINIYSGSWGPEDNGITIEGPGALASAAFEKGVTQGRNGLGNIFVWASGNGGKFSDSCACDGYASSMYTLSVGSVSEKNMKPWYLEECASTIASTYSSGSPAEKQIVTTDLHNQCTRKHSGTSASAPLAAGMVALILEANPKLTWRDVQYITIVTANSLPIKDGNFITNGVGRRVSLAYGYGLMDGGKMVRLAELWLSLPIQRSCRVRSKNYLQHLSKVFSHKFKISLSSCSTSSSNVRYLEHVQLYVSLNFGQWGDIEIALYSPSGTRSVMLPRRPKDRRSGTMPLNHLALMSVQFWGEKAQGDWFVEISNTRASDHYAAGIFQYSELHIYGTKEQPMRLRKPKPHRLPPNAWFSQFSRYIVDDNLITDSGIIECDEECFNETSCSAAGAANCLSCKHYKDISQVCVKQCPFGQYAVPDSKDAQSGTCLACHETCAGCIGPGKHNCTACLPLAPLLISDKNTCDSRKSCPKRYFREGDICYPCGKNCSDCKQKHFCLQCDSPLVVRMSKGCGKECEAESYSDEGRVCQACHYRCSACIGGSNVSCTACKSGFNLVKASAADKIGMCSDKCPEQHYIDKATKKCNRCHFDCANCTGPGSNECLTCRPPLVLSENKACVNDKCLRKSCPPISCKRGEFSDHTKKSPICVKCHPTCRTCTGPADKNCSSCSDNEQCVWPPPSTLQRVYGKCLPCCPNSGIWEGEKLGPNRTVLCGFCLPPVTNVCLEPYKYQSYIHSRDPDKLPSSKPPIANYFNIFLLIGSILGAFLLLISVFVYLQCKPNGKRKHLDFSKKVSYAPLKNRDDSDDEEENSLFLKDATYSNGSAHQINLSLET